MRSRCVKFVAFTLLLSLLTGPLGSALHAADCDTVLVQETELREAISREFESELAEYPDIKLSFVYRYSHIRLKTRALQVCKDLNYCSPDKIRMVVQETMQELLSKVEKTEQRVRYIYGYSIWTGILIAAALTKVGTSTQALTLQAIISEMIQPAIFMAAMSFSRPLTEKVTGYASRAAYRMTAGKSMKLHHDVQVFQQTFERMQGKYDGTEMQARTAIMSFRAIVSGALKDAVTPLLDNPPGSPRWQRGVNMIAELPVLLRGSFQDITYDNPQVLTVFKLYFSDVFKDDAERLQIRQAVTAKIKELDPKYDEPDTRAFYENALDHWFTKNPIAPNDRPPGPPLSAVR